MEKAKTLAMIEALANGIDPLSGEVLPAGHLLQQPDILRALFQATAYLRGGRNVSAGLTKNGSRWSAEEDEALRQAFGADNSISQIAKTHERTYGAIRSRLMKLGLISDE